MKQLIARCGIDCENCDARIATIANDDHLREETAQKWQAMYDSPDITAESINCVGCRVDGVKIGHYADCEIRKCAESKGYGTCGECGELDACPTVAPVLQHVPGAKNNLTGKCGCGVA